MSCRAFARRIEHQTLKMLFDTAGASEIEFRLHADGEERAAARVICDLLGEEPQSEFRLTRSQFEANCPALYHEVREMRRAEAHG